MLEDQINSHIFGDLEIEYANRFFVRKECSCQPAQKLFNYSFICLAVAC